MRATPWAWDQIHLCITNGHSKQGVGGGGTALAEASAANPFGGESTPFAGFLRQLDRELIRCPHSISSQPWAVNTAITSRLFMNKRAFLIVDEKRQ